MHAKKSIVLLYSVLIIPLFWLLAMAGPQRGRLPVVSADTSKGEPTVTLTLSDGAGAGPKTSLPKATSGTPLSASGTQQLLKRLPEDGERAEVAGFAFRDRSLPAPRPGETLDTPFPPKTTGPAPDNAPEAPLTVLRFAPEGEVSQAGRISITFSQPMVPLTTHEVLAGEDLPVTMTPRIDGNWRWLGTRTLVFESGSRLPGATRFSLEVPDHVTSYAGTPIEAPAQWHFTTPPARLVNHYPTDHGTHGQETVLYLEFDQKIDPTTALAMIEVRGKGTRTGVRLARADEIDANPRMTDLQKNAPAGRHLFVVPAVPIPGGIQATVTLKKGFPSAEGPLTTIEDQDFTYRVYGEFKSTGTRCGYGRQCRPGHALSIMFSNTIDPKTFKQSMVSVEPAIPGMRISPSGNALTINGLTKARTTYTVTVNANLTDMFGQTLGKSETHSFAIDAAEDHLFTTGGDLVVLDPAATPGYSIYSINHKHADVQIFRVTEKDWATWLNGKNRRHNETRTYPGQKVFDDRITIDNQPDQLVETVVDLSPHLDGGLGHVIVVVKTVKFLSFMKKPTEYAAWVQSTDLGVAAYYDQHHLIARASSLSDGSSLDKVSFDIQTLDGTMIHQAKGDPEGVMRLPLPQDQNSKLMVVRRGTDMALLPERNWYGRGSNWTKQTVRHTGLWYAVNDRGLYRPGETAHIKGWVRFLQNGEDLVLPKRDRVSYVVNDARGNRLASGDAALSAAGGFHISLDLPDNMNLGHATMMIDGGELGRTHVGLKVQEFRRPEFEVSVSAQPGPYLLGEATEAEAKASYYAGGPLNSSDVQWSVRVNDTAFVPPNRSKFQFGSPVFSWMRHMDRNQSTDSFSHQGITDSTGKHSMRLSFDTMAEPRPRNVHINAGVVDLNNQRISGSTNLILHPAAHYVGIRSERYFVEKGQPLDLSMIVCDLDGKAVSGSPITVTLSQQFWDWSSGEQEEKTISTHTLKSADEPVTLALDMNEGGSFVITAEIKDAQGRVNRTRITRWVSGGQLVQAKRVQQQEIQLIPDKETYQPGDVAEILVQSPFHPATGMVSLRQTNALDTRILKMDGPTHTLRIPITEEHIPNLHVVVDLDGAAPRTGSDGRIDETLPTRPAYAGGNLTLKVPPLKHELDVAIIPDQKELMPGEETELEIRVSGAHGKARGGAEVAVWVVDEAILALANYKVQDPLLNFYPQQHDRTRAMNLRSYLLLKDPETLLEASVENVDMEMVSDSMPLAEAPSSPMPTSRRAMKVSPQAMALTAPPASAGEVDPIAVRTDFSALAAYFAEQPTDGRGKTRVTVKLPDNLTRYRIIAVAVDGNNFGTGEAGLTARLPLMVRPAPPRFLNFGDQFDLAVMLQNQTDEPLTVDLAVEAVNANLIDGAGRQVVVPANDRIRVLFPAEASQPGTARIRIAAATKGFADAAACTIPVWTPATTEAFATYGVLDEGSVGQAVRVPVNVHPQIGGLQITTASTALQGLSDAVIYMNDYPYAYPEVMASRLLTLAALVDVLTAFDADLDRTAAEATMKRDLDHLQRLQNSNGGFGFWRRDDRSNPYLTVHVAHALARAQKRGIQVPQNLQSRIDTFLDRIDSRIPKTYGDTARLTIETYALYVQNLQGKANQGRAEQLLKRLPMEKMPLDVLGRLLPMVGGNNQQRIQRHLLNRVEETSSAASFTGSYGDQSWLVLHSGRSDDALVLEGMIAVDPNNDLIPKLVNGLMAGRVKGRWSGTQENAFILLALDRYFRTYENQKPDFTARVWLGEGYAGEHKYAGRTPNRNRIDIPMTWLVDNETEPQLVMAKDGTGRLYYRLGMSYAPVDLQLAAASHGFFIERRYEAINDPADVRRDEDGTWRIRAGADVRVVVEMVAPARRHHVALVDQLPAGLEPVAVDEMRPGRQDFGGCFLWWPRPWYDHINLRDERVEAMSTTLYGGVHKLSYTARATTTGDFVTPPAKAEEMYNPETFGRTASSRVIVE